MKFFERLKRIFVTDSRMLDEISESMTQENIECLRVFSVIGFLIFSLLTAVSLFASSINDYLPVYLTYAVLCLVYVFLSRVIKNVRMMKALVYSFMFVIISFGIILGPVFSPDELSVSYVVLMFAVPLGFTGKPGRINFVVGLSMAVYIIISCLTETRELLLYNMVSIIPYGLASMLISSFVMNIKLQRIHYRKANTVLEAMDREEAERRRSYEGFINKMIRSTSTVSDPEQAISELLAYVGENLSSERAYIFEKNESGNFDNTYEWCGEGIPSQMLLLKNVGESDLPADLIRSLTQGRPVIIHDMEEKSSRDSGFYKYLKSVSMKSVVAGPIIIDDRLMGFFGVDNTPAESVDKIPELLDMMAFAFCMMIRFRNSRRRIEESARHDHLTGCLNRGALSWVYDSSFNREQSVLLIVCDMNGLKEVNDLQGHTAGDRFILRTADILKQTFGEKHVYRMGGDEFIVLLIGDETRGLEEKITAARLLIGDTASLGIERRERLDVPFDELLKAADRRMYEEKNEYYRLHPERKRH